MMIGRHLLAWKRPRRCARSTLSGCSWMLAHSSKEIVSFCSVWHHDSEGESEMPWNMRLSLSSLSSKSLTGAATVMFSFRTTWIGMARNSRDKSSSATDRDSRVDNRVQMSATCALIDLWFFFISSTDLIKPAWPFSMLCERVFKLCNRVIISANEGSGWTPASDRRLVSGPGLVSTSLESSSNEKTSEHSRIVHKNTCGHGKTTRNLLPVFL